MKTQQRGKGSTEIGLSDGDFYLCPTAWLHGLHRRRNLRKHTANQPPAVPLDYDYRQFAALQILLVWQVCIRRQQNVKSCFFRSAEQFTV